MPLLNIAGGTALILFGVAFLRAGLDRLFGHRLADWLEKLASNRWRAFFAGLSLALVAPSSTTMSVLAVQTLAGGRAPARNLLGVMLGANIGLTAMVLVVSLHLYDYAPILLLPGVLLYQYAGRTQSRGAGQVAMAMAFIFMGVGIIKVGAGTLETYPTVTQFLSLAGSQPLLMALAAGVLAVVLQSSTAVISMVMGLSGAEHMGMGMALPAVVGADVGIAVTTLIVGWANLEARRLAVGNLLLKLTVAGAVYALFTPLAAALSALPCDLVKQIAGTQLAFNLSVALIGMPLLTPVGALVEWLVRPGRQPAAFGPRYLGTLPVTYTPLALGQSLKEIMHVSEIVRAMFADTWTALDTRDRERAAAVVARDDQVDLLDREIKRYLSRLNQHDLDETSARAQMMQLRYLNELETVGDILEKDLAPLAIKRADEQLVFSPEGWEDLQACRALVEENLSIAETVFVTRDRELATQLMRHKERLSTFKEELRDRHFARLRAGQALSQESSSVHLDVLSDLERINSCICHVGLAVLQWTETPPPTVSAAANVRPAPPLPAAGDG